MVANGRPRIPAQCWAWSGSLLLLPLLSGCSGTPFGEALSRSFSAPPSSSGQPTTPAQASSSGPSAGLSARTSPPAGLPGPASAAKGGASGTAVPLASGDASSGGGSPKAKPSAAAPPALATATDAAVRSRPGTPTAPYRVTLRLPQADPSAPAEGMTQALRSAGVAFEVETIERVAGSSSGSGAAPAPSGGSGAAPTVRQAPPPR